MLKDYHLGNMTLVRAGDKGRVTDITYTSAPDFGLYNIRVIHVTFGLTVKIGLAQSIAEEYMEEI